MPPATLLHIEKTQWSPNCRIKSQGQGRSGQTFSGARSSTLRPGVLSLTLTCLATLAQASASFSKSRLCRVRRRFPGSEALRCKGSGIYSMPIAANCVCHSRAEQYSRWAPNLCCGVCGVTKPGSSKIKAIRGRHTILLSCGKSALQSWLNLANSLMTKERPYVFRSSLGAIWTPQDWHEMASASAGLSCMTSHGGGHMLVPLLFRIEVAGILFRAGGTDFRTDLGLPKGRRQVRGRSGIK